MNWKARQRHLAEMRWKKRGGDIPPPPVKVLKVCNPVVKAIFGGFCEKKPIVGPVIMARNRWGDVHAVPKASPFKCPFNFIDRLEKRGYKRLGAGAYSTVLGKDGSDRVIKVSRSLDNWIDYVQWGAKEGYAGSFVPRVYSWKKFERPPTAEFGGYERSNDWSVAVVERMEATCTDHKHDMALLLNLYYPAQCGNTMAAVYMDDLAPGSYQFFQALNANHFNSDMGGKNVMLRKDGSFCVTDPCCGNIKTDKKRFRTGDLSPSALRNIFESCYRHRSQWIKEPYQGLVSRL